jgi:hypothetical protein
MEQSLIGKIPNLVLVIIGSTGLLETIGVITLPGDVPMLFFSAYLCLITSGVLGIKYKVDTFLGFGIFWLFLALAGKKYLYLIPLSHDVIQNISVILASITMLCFGSIVRGCEK